MRHREAINARVKTLASLLGEDRDVQLRQAGTTAWLLTMTDTNGRPQGQQVELSAATGRELLRALDLLIEGYYLALETITD